jgi:uncharacterized protein (TIGR03437 family)
VAKVLLALGCGILCLAARSRASDNASPPGILYSTTLINSDTASFPQVSAVTLDAAGNSYATGSIRSNGLQATPGVVQPRYAGGSCQVTPMSSLPCEDAFIAKFNAQGQLVFLTYLGGTGSDIPISIAVDSIGNIYVAGFTGSRDFPLAGSPWRPVLQSGGGGTSFVAKLTPNGSALIYSTVVNGSLTSMVTVADGTVYFITQSYVDQPMNLTKLTPGGSLVSNLTVPSGTQTVAVDHNGSVFIGGRTAGADVFATKGAWQSAFGGGDADGFVAKLGTDLAHYAWVTFIGGSETDYVTSMQTDPSGAIWVAGGTQSSNFPVLANAWQLHAAPPLFSYANYNGFLVRLSGDGSKALASTYVPGFPQSLSVDTAADVIISVSNTSPFQATPGAQWPCIQPSGDGFGHLGIGAASQFFAKLDPLGKHLLWGTWVGPSIPGGPAGTDNRGNAIAAGNIPGERNLTLAAMIMQPGPSRLVASCVSEAGYPYMPGAIAPGEILSIYGAGFGPQQGVSAQVINNRIGTQLGGVQVLVEGAPAPLLYVSAEQINLIAPYSIGGLADAHIRIVSSVTSSNEVVLPVAPAVPEIFESQPGFAAILNQDGTVNGPSHPAHPGDIVTLFASGAGEMMPTAVDGDVPQTPVRKPVLPVRLHLGAGINNFDADIQYAGEAPMRVSGLLQVNFRAPTVVAAGPPPYYVYLDLYIGNFGSSAQRVLVVSE